MFRGDSDEALEVELRIRGLVHGVVIRPLDSTVGDLRLAVGHSLGGRSAERDRLLSIGTYLIDQVDELILDDDNKTLREYGLNGGYAPTVRVIKPRGPAQVVVVPAEAGQPRKVWVRVKKKPKPPVAESKASPEPVTDLDGVSDSDATPPESSSSSSSDNTSEDSEARYLRKERQREEREIKRKARGEKRIRKRFAAASKPDPPEALAVLGGDRTWTRPLSACCASPAARSLALKAAVCMPCAYGLAIQQEKLRFSTLVNVLCCCIVAPWNRTLLRDKRRIHGTPWEDYCVHCCPVTCCCAKCQEIAETQTPSTFLMATPMTGVQVRGSKESPQTAPQPVTMDDQPIDLPGTPAPATAPPTNPGSHAKVMPSPSSLRQPDEEDAESGAGNTRKKVTFKSVDEES